MKLITLSLLLAATAVAQDPSKADTEADKVRDQSADKPIATQDADAKKDEPLEVGSTIAKQVSSKDIDGKEFKFEDARGKPVVLHFWSITCPYEEAAEPKLMKIAKDYADKALVLAVNSNRNEIGAKPDDASFAAEKDEDKPYQSIRKHVESVKLNHRVLIDHDGSIAKLLEGKTTPHCFVFDKDGVLRYQGALDDDARDKKGDEATNYVRQALDAVLAGKEVETKTTRPYG